LQSAPADSLPLAEKDFFQTRCAECHVLPDTSVYPIFTLEQMLDDHTQQMLLTEDEVERVLRLLEKKRISRL
jgi:hypothetical protein